MLGLQQHFVIWLILVALLGLMVGSFLNVVIYRLPIMLNQKWQQQCYYYLNLKNADLAPARIFNLIWPASHCPHCQTKIKIRHIIPLLSFLWLRGKCCTCKTAFSWQYPLVEFLSSLMTVATLWQLGMSPNGIAGILLTWSLIALAFIDFNTQLLPDDITLMLLWSGITLNLFGVFTDIQSAVIGAIAAYLSLWSINYLFKILIRKQGMGQGDFKLYAALGAWLGWQFLPIIILMAASLGSVVGLSLVIFKRQESSLPIAFGPHLALAGWITLLYGKTLIHLYGIQF